MEETPCLCEEQGLSMSSMFLSVLHMTNSAQCDREASAGAVVVGVCGIFDGLCLPGGVLPAHGRGGMIIKPLDTLARYL